MSDFDPVDVAAQESMEAARRDAEAHEAAKDADAIRWLMADQKGRRFMRRLLEQTGVFRVSFTPDARLTDFREGERNVGLRHLALVTEHAPEGLVELLTAKD